MRISYLASALLAICFLPLSTPAFAGCGGANCATSGNAITYGSGSYGAFSAPTTYRSNAHVSSGINTSYGVANSAACPSGTTRANDGYCMATASRSTGNRSSVGFSNSSAYASSSAVSSSAASSPAYARSSAYANSSAMRGTMSGSTYRSTGQVVPFTTSVSKISNYRVAGMANNEFLSPTTCPTNVYNPGGDKVLGCYKVVKPLQVARPVPQIRYQQVRVVRPIIYVRYPVPMPMPVPMQMPVPVCRTQTVCNSGCNSMTYSRYGNAWPQGGSNCGRWF